MKKRKTSYLDYDGYGGYPRSGSHNSYNKTANAYSYEMNPRLMPDIHEEKRGAIKRKKIVKRKRAVVYEKLIDKSIKINKAFVIYAILFFIGAMSLIMLNAMYENKKSSVESLRQELKVLRESNQDARIALASSYDENEIALLAEKLGMSKPKPYQITYINVPKESYAKGLGTTMQTEEGASLLDRITAFLLEW